MAHENRDPGVIGCFSFPIAARPQRLCSRLIRLTPRFGRFSATWNSTPVARLLSGPTFDCTVLLRQWQARSMRSH